MTLIREAIELTRQGRNGGWRVAIPVYKQASTMDGDTVRLPRAPITYDAADLMHDEEFAACMVLVDKVTARIVTGDLAPLPVEPPTPS